MFEGLPEDTTYAELLEFLKRDLRLDATVDILDGTIFAALTLAGASQFLQTKSTKQIVSWGALVTGNAPTVSIAGSGDWNVTGGFGTGVAQLNWNPVKVTAPTIITSCGSTGAFFVGTDTSLVNHAIVRSFTSAGAVTNLVVNFIALG